MEIDLVAQPLRVEQPRASAEALLHTAIYRRFPTVGAVLHVQTVGSTVLSRRVGAGRQVRLSGYELLEAMSGTRTHEAEIRVPVFANDQDLARLARQVCAWWGTAGASNAVPALLLEGHGLYAWGATIEDAPRHLEALEFIFNHANSSSATTTARSWPPSSSRCSPAPGCTTSSSSPICATCCASSPAGFGTA